MAAATAQAPCAPLPTAPLPTAPATTVPATTAPAVDAARATGAVAPGALPTAPAPESSSPGDTGPPGAVPSTTTTLGNALHGAASPQDAQPAGADPRDAQPAIPDALSAESPAPDSSFAAEQDTSQPAFEMGAPGLPKLRLKRLRKVQNTLGRELVFSGRNESDGVGDFDGVGGLVGRGAQPSGETREESSLRGNVAAEEDLSLRGAERWSGDKQGIRLPERGRRRSRQRRALLSRRIFPAPGPRTCPCKYSWRKRRREERREKWYQAGGAQNDS